MKFRFGSVILILSLMHLLAYGDLPQYTKGEGLVMEINSSSGAAEVVIAIVESDSNKLVLDIKMSSMAGFSAIELTQQFHLKYKGEKIIIEKAFISSPLWENKTYNLDDEYLNSYDGVSLDSFLFKKDLPSAYKYIGDSKVTTIKGKVIPAKKFELEENSQKLQFWISDSIKPFGLAAIKSQGPKSDQNYIIGYKGLIKAYKSAVNIEKALGITEKIKSYLPKQKNKKSLFLP